MKNSFPNFGNGNGRPVFPGMVGNGNSRSPLACAWLHISDLSLILNFKFKDVEEENIEFDQNEIFDLLRNSPLIHSQFPLSSVVGFGCPSPPPPESNAGLQQVFKKQH